MNLSKREFLQVLSAAGVAGMGLGRWSQADAATAADKLYDMPKFGNVSFLHMTDCHAQLKPIYFREPSVNLGVAGMSGQLPHLVGEHMLKIAKVPAGSARCCWTAATPGRARRHRCGRRARTWSMRPSCWAWTS
jgi:sulfur-oxidizing protein SoxB